VERVPDRAALGDRDLGGGTGRPDSLPVLRQQGRLATRQCRDEDRPFGEGARAELERLRIAVAAQRSGRQAVATASTMKATSRAGCSRGRKELRLGIATTETFIHSSSDWRSRPVGCAPPLSACTVQMGALSAHNRSSINGSRRRSRR